MIQSEWNSPQWHENAKSAHTEAGVKKVDTHKNLSLSQLHLSPAPQQKKYKRIDLAIKRNIELCAK